MKTIFVAAALCATSGFAAVPSTTTLTQGGVAGAYDLTAIVTGTGGSAPSGSVAFVDNNDPSGSPRVLATSPLVPSVTTIGQPIALTTAATSAGPLVAGDFNGDGILDLAVASGSSVVVFLGKGDGTFTTGPVLPVASQPLAVVTGRFARQGHLDLAVANGNGVTVFLGNGNGTFAAGQTFTVPGTPFGMAVGSFGGTASDLIVTGNGHTSVLLNNGDGTFQPAVDTVIPGLSPAAVVATSFGAVVVQSGTNPGALIALLNAGGGTFTVKPAIVTGIGHASIAAGDFDGDGIEDVAVVSALDETLTIFSGDGTGSFTPGKPIPAGAFSLGVVAADFNNDGRADLAVGSPTSGLVTLLLGKGGGAFTTATVAAGLNATFLAAGDFDKEGHVDLAVSGSSNLVNVLLTQTQRTAIATASGIALAGVGTHQVVASYPGDGAYAASVSAATSLTTAPTVTFTPEQPNLTIAKLGDSPSEKIAINSAGNFSGSIALSCLVTFTGTGSAAAVPVCVIDKTLNVTPQAAVSATLSITTAAPTSLQTQAPHAAFGMLLLLGFVPKLRRKKAWLLLAFAFLATASACGNNLASFATAGTTPGTYRVDVTAVSTTPPFTAVTPISVTVPAQ